MEAAFFTLDPEKLGGAAYGTLDHAAREAGCDKPPPQPTSDEVFAVVEAPSPQPTSDPFRSQAPQVRLRSGANAIERKVEWLWPGYLARGKYEAFGGGKGAGKSTIAYDLGARLSVGGTWPDGTKAPLGDFLVWSGEDDFEDTILPRFLVAGGDRSRVCHVEDVVTNEGKRPFDPARDIPGLIAVARQPSA